MPTCKESGSYDRHKVTCDLPVQLVHERHECLVPNDYTGMTYSWATKETENSDD